MRIKGIIRHIFFNDVPLTERDYRVSRNLFTAEGATARLIFNLTSGAFLAGFARYLGANEEFSGIIAALPAFAGAIQIFSPMVFEKLEKRKAIIALSCLLHRLLLGFMIFIPLLTPNRTVRLALISITYLISHLLGSFIAPAASGWIIDLTPGNIRGKYFGIREFLILPVVTVATVAFGRLLDNFKMAGNEYRGFLWVFLSVIGLALANFYLLSSIKEPAVKKGNISLDIKSILTIPLKDRSFRKIVVLFFLWNIGFHVGGPFFSIFMVTGLKLDYTYIMILDIIATVSNLAVVRLWGKVADRKSWVFTTKVSIGMLALCHFLWFFVNPVTAAMLLPPLYILAGISWAGINISTFNIQFDFTPENGRTVYLGFNSALSGFVGFASALVGSGLVAAFKGVDIKMGGATAGNMQLVFALSGIILGICTLYIHCFIKERKKT